MANDIYSTLLFLLTHLKRRSYSRNNPLRSQTTALSPIRPFGDILSSYASPLLDERFEFQGLTALPRPNPFFLSHYNRTQKQGGPGYRPNSLHHDAQNPIHSSAKRVQDASIPRKISRSIRQAADKHGIPDRLIQAVIRAESNFDVRSVSKVGAQGLMQLMPDTAKDLGVKDPFDIEQNIEGGTRYLKKMLDLFEGDVKLALAAYNAGPGTVKRYKGIPPYPETKTYVDRVLNFSKIG